MMENKLTVEELIKTLRCGMVETGSLLCLGCGHEHNCSTHGCAIMRQAADALEQLNDFEHSQLAKMLAENTRLAEKVPHWISVKDRLPEKDGNYLAVMDGDLCGQEEPFTSMCGIEKGKWDEPNMVLYWMPLPKTPKEEK